YTAEDNQFIAQIYEPPLQYHLLKRPYTLIPLTAATIPEVHFYDAQGHLLSNQPDPSNVAYSTYDIVLKSGIFYQPHPAFALDQSGHYLYLNLTEQQLKKIDTMNDFAKSGTRELIADDYVYELKRLADPRVQSPIFSLMSKHILGLADLAKTLQQIPDKNFDLRNYSLAGAKVIDRYHYQITVQGFYPQFIYWLAMPFFAPIPWEAVQFYSQKGMEAKNITLDWQPIGTGAYMLTENNPNRKIILKRNPNFHSEFYPTEGAPGDREKGYLQNAGKPLPMIDQIYFTLDRESIPRWNKFMQGYYDTASVSSDSFDQAVQINSQGQADLTPTLQKRKMRLSVTIEPALFYIGFNMLDPVVGGYSLKQEKLRRALAIAIDQEEYIHIFLNGR
ncbi:MAG: peptide ABC transporter substrate-binding protein, partial [Proteobacteria bacterium]|nr:peptide ABC transporter substrate-binding protein [Pseudomonadota bacterium]